MALKPQVKSDWLAALRSGDYKQARGVLCDQNDKMCCLGVLYDSAIDGNWTHKEYAKGPAAWGISTRKSYGSGPAWIETSITELPYNLLNKIGMDEEEQAQLVMMNDVQKKGFRYIANWIERNL